MIQALQTAIYARATSAGAFNTAIGGKFYYAQAPDNTSGKYAVISDVANPNTRNTVSHFEDCYFQIALYDIDYKHDVNTSIGVYDLSSKCMALFDNCEGALTVSGYSVTEFTRLNIIGPRRTEGGWVIILNYHCKIEKGR